MRVDWAMMSFSSSAVRLSPRRRRSVASVVGVFLSEGIVSLQVVRPDIEVTQSWPVGQRESERGFESALPASGFEDGG